MLTGTARENGNWVAFPPTPVARSRVTEITRTEAHSGQEDAQQNGMRYNGRDGLHQQVTTSSIFCVLLDPGEVDRLKIQEKTIRLHIATT